LYLYELKKLEADHEVISGEGEERLKNAISAVEKRFLKPT
jgi:hypothetical protein